MHVQGEAENRLQKDWHRWLTSLFATHCPSFPQTVPGAFCAIKKTIAIKEWPCQEIYTWPGVGQSNERGLHMVVSRHCVS